MALQTFKCVSPAQPMNQSGAPYYLGIYDQVRQLRLGGDDVIDYFCADKPQWKHAITIDGRPAWFHEQAADFPLDILPGLPAEWAGKTTGDLNAAGKAFGFRVIPATAKKLPGSMALIEP